MATLKARSELVVGTNLLIDEAARTFEFVDGAGSLIAKDGVTIQALYGKFVDLWATLSYQDSPFPMNALDALSGQFYFGVDAGGNNNGWKPKNDTTRQMLRDGGWNEYDNTGGLTRQYAGMGGLGSVSLGSQLYFQRDPNDAPTNFTFTDQANEGIQVFGDSSNGNFDKRTFFKGFVREQGKKFKDSVLADTGKTATGAFIVNLLLSNENDLKISDADSEMSSTPYDGITVEYFDTNQSRLIGGSNFNYNIIIDGNGAPLEKVYTKCQYLLRQSNDIDSGSGSVIGQTANVLCAFVGETLNTSTGVFIDNVAAADSNRVTFSDTGGTARANPFEAAGKLSFNPVMVQLGSSYRLMYTSPDGADNDYAEDGNGVVTVNDASGNPITGVIDAFEIPFTFDYDNDSVAAAAGTDKAVTLIGIAPGFSKFAVAVGTLTQSKVITIGLVAETDRAYL